MATEEEVLSRFKWDVSLEELMTEGKRMTNQTPRTIYNDPDLFELEKKKIFKGSTWHLVAHEAELPNPGDFKTTRIMDVPIVISRNENGQVNVLVNACAHRGAQVVHESCGNAKGKGFRCIYHQWGFNLEGICTAVTLPDDFPEDFKKEDYGMPKLRFEIMTGAIFVSFSPDTPNLDEYFGDEAYVDQIKKSLWQGKLKLLGTQKMVFGCNWKLYMENMYDGYHALTLHKGVKMLGGRRPRKAPGSTFSPNHFNYGHGWQHYLNDGNKDKVLNDMSIVEIRSKIPNEEGFSPSDILFSFPANIISDQADTLTIRYVLPVAHDKTEVHFTIFAQEDESMEMMEHRVRQGSNLFGPMGVITLEDGFALKRIQDASAAGGNNHILKGSPKRFPPYRIIDEAAITHFYTGYRKMMGF